VELVRFMGKLGEDPIMVSREYAEVRVRGQIVGLLEREMFMGGVSNTGCRSKFEPVRRGVRHPSFPCRCLFIEEGTGKGGERD
jgi:hypothetical protein